MSPENTPSQRICPTCGSKVAGDANRCLVCGAVLSAPEKPIQSSKVVQGSRIPEITLSLPVAFLLFALFLGIGAVLVYFALSQKKTEVVTLPTSTVAVTMTVTPSPTATTVVLPSDTPTPEPTPTPLTHVVKENETCIEIALFYGVSVQSIVALNNLPASCNNLYINQPLKIPQPTPTATPLPSATLNPAQQTEAACEKATHTVTENQTLSGIAAAYGVPMEAIREYNGLPGNNVYLGQPLIIPLCKKFATPGPTPTPTLPPPYAAPSLLLPADGAAVAGNEVVTLQWAAVGALRSDEAYAVVIEDLTAADGTRVMEYVTDTKLILPTSLRPPAGTAHVMRWRVNVVRQSGTDTSGRAVWDEAGAVSTPRVFVWLGSGSSGSPVP